MMTLIARRISRLIIEAANSMKASTRHRGDDAVTIYVCLSSVCRQQQALSGEGASASRCGDLRRPFHRPSLFRNGERAGLFTARNR